MKRFRFFLARQLVKRYQYPLYEHYARLGDTPEADPALVRLAPCAWHVEMRGETGGKLARNRMIAALEGLDVPRSVIDWVLEDQDQ